MESAATAKKTRILVVDDENGICQSVDKILTRRGFAVTQAQSVHNALDVLKREESVDMIIADLMMPQVGGLELLKMVKENSPALPFLMITGFPTIPTAVEATRLGAAGFLPKPFTPEELEAAVKRALAEVPAVPAERGTIDADLPFDALEVAHATSAAYVEHLTRSDVPVVQAPAKRPAVAADFCALGQRSCKKFVSKGVCPGKECPLVVAERRKAAQHQTLHDKIEDPVDVDMPFSYAELSAAAGEAYAASVGPSGIPVVSHYREAKASVKAPRVLVVDDEAVVANSIRRTLARRGYDIAEAFNGREALERLAAEPFDLVLLDMKLGSENGLDLLSTIKKGNPDLPVVMVTGYASVDTAVDAIKRGADDYMAKPFTPEELYGVARKTLRQTVN
jgi:DNA-binding NtrC family response regulator